MKNMLAHTHTNKYGHTDKHTYRHVDIFEGKGFLSYFIFLISLYLSFSLICFLFFSLLTFPIIAPFPLPLSTNHNYVSMTKRGNCKGMGEGAKNIGISLNLCLLFFIFPQNMMLSIRLQNLLPKSLAYYLLFWAV